MQNLNIAPKNYISGYDNLKELGESVKKISQKSLILSDETVYSVVKEALESLTEHKIEYKKEIFSGECNYDEIDRITKLLKDGDYTSIIGFGGGKIMDTVKASGFKAEVKIITVPTSAATCAAWSSHSAIYTFAGIAYEYMNIYRNPDLLYMDKKIIAEAPARYIIAGIQDTLAKWIETDASTQNMDKKNTETEIAMYLAKKTYDEMFEYSIKAIDDIKKGEYTEEIDKIIENVILTAGLVGGIGGEACRAVAAHALNNGFTVIPEIYRKNLHGEVVGFGNIVQMILDKKEENEIEVVIKFYKGINARCTMQDLGYNDLSERDEEAIINRALYKGDTIWNLPYVVTYDELKNAIKKADKLIINN